MFYERDFVAATCCEAPGWRAKLKKNMYIPQPTTDFGKKTVVHYAMLS